MFAKISGKLLFSLKFYSGLEYYVRCFFYFFALFDLSYDHCAPHSQMLLIVMKKFLVILLTQEPLEGSLNHRSRHSSLSNITCALSLSLGQSTFNLS